MKRPLFWASLSSIAGCLIVLTEQHIIMITVIILSVVTIGLLRAVSKVPRIAYCLLIPMVLGALRTGSFLSSERNAVREYLTADAIEGIVVETSEQNCIVKPMRVGVSDGSDTVFYEPDERFRIVVYIDGSEAPKAGEHLILSSLQTITIASNDGEWDAYTYYRGQSVVASCSEYAKTGIAEQSLRYRLTWLRESVRARIRYLYPSSSEPVVTGLLCGDRSDMDPEMTDRFRDLGIAHILAVSGMHISVLGSVLTALFLLQLRRPHAGLLAGIGLLIYGRLIGYPVSCMRAVLLFLFCRIGLCFRRTPDRPTATALLMALMLLLRPNFVFQTSFFLSFYCASVIPFLQWLTEHKKTPETGIPENAFSRVCKRLHFPILLHMLLLPVQVFFFYKTSPYAPILNLLVIPIVGGIFLLALLSVAISFVSLYTGFFIAGSVHLLVRLLDRLTVAFSKLPRAVIVLGRPSWVNYVFFVIAAVFLLIRFFRGKPYVMIVAVFSFLCLAPIRGRSLRIYNLSVGQGDCAVVIKGGNCFVIDCGSSSKKNVGEKILQPFLLYRGFSQPDAVFVTHTDADHTNGLDTLLADAWSDVTVYLPQHELQSDWAENVRAGRGMSGVGENDISGLGDAEGNTRILGLSGGSVLRMTCGLFDTRTLEVEVLWPLNVADDDTSVDRNEGNLVLVVSDESGSALFLADSDREVMETLTLLYERKIVHCCYVKVAHHGSAYSDCEELYHLSSPVTAVISVGRNNYGHPSDSILEILRNNCERYFVTMNDGQITTILRDGQVRSEAFFRR